MCSNRLANHILLHSKISIDFMSERNAGTISGHAKQKCVDQKTTEHNKKQF